MEAYCLQGVMMAIETLNHEAGDDRERSASIERLYEMYGTGTDESLFVPDEMPDNVDQMFPGIGDISIPEVRHGRGGIPPQLGRTALHRVHTLSVATTHRSPHVHYPEVPPSNNIG